MLIEMHVHALRLDPATRMPVVILEELASERLLPIWIGFFEARAIKHELAGAAERGRPLTHDLCGDLLAAAGGKIVQVAITELRQSTFFATVTVEHGGQRSDVDARPSDAIVLALRSGAPILVEERVLETAQARAAELASASVSSPGEEEESFEPGAEERVAVLHLRDDERDEAKLREVLEKLELERFGKYKM